MNGLMFRKATRADANAMLMLLHSITTEGDTLPFQNGIDGDLIDSQWLGAFGCVLACRGDLCLVCTATALTCQVVVRMLQLLLSWLRNSHGGKALAARSYGIVSWKRRHQDFA